MSIYPSLVALAGYAGSGKDTAGDELVARLGFVKFSFSDALYLEVSEAFSLSIEQLKDRDLKESPTLLLALRQCADADFISRMLVEGLDPERSNSPREILQWWGTEYRREQHPDYWVKKARDFYRQQIAAGAVGLVNCSCRFLNEANWIHEEGGLVLRMVRPGVSAVNAHSSDTPLPDDLVDADIDNSGSVEDLYENVMAAFSLLKAA